MADVILTRVFRAGIDHVFAYVTQTEHLLKWWGPEGITVPVHALDFSRPGPWSSEMHAPDGRIFRVSGEVIDLTPPKSVAFTWAWHDDDGERGHESRVLFELEDLGSETRFTLTHSGLADQESARNHDEGWTSSLSKLERQF